MNRYGVGIIAGFAATIALSLIMVIKAAAGFMPMLNVIALLSALLGNPGVPLVGWTAHFVIGAIIWGALFAALVPSLPGAYCVRGAIFSGGAWLAMMIILMPLAGKGVFAAHAGLPVAVATLVLHLIYGVVLGAVFGGLIGKREAVPA